MSGVRAGLAGLAVLGLLATGVEAGRRDIDLLSRGAATPDLAIASEPVVSASGRYVAFSSPAANLVPGQVDGGASFDVFLYDAETGTITLVSRSVASPVTTGNGSSFTPVISADGRFVAFGSLATDLVPGQVDAAGTVDVFLYDRIAGTTTLVSRTAGSPTTAGNGEARLWVMSADGKVVAFDSTATDLVAGQVDPADTSDVFAYDREAASTTLVSRSATSPVTAGNDRSFEPWISGNGRFVGFTSLATDLVPGQVDPNGVEDAFLHDRPTGTTALVSHASGSATTSGNGISVSPRPSDDGAFVVFAGVATDLVPGQNDTNDDFDVFLYQTSNGATVLVSHASGSPTTSGEAGSGLPVISADAASVVFSSLAKNLVAGQSDTSFSEDVFLYDRTGGGTVSLLGGILGSATSASGLSRQAVISADGQFVAFTSGNSNLFPAQNDVNHIDDVFLFDRAAGTTRLVSHAPLSGGTTGNASSSAPQISADGRTVVFVSHASDLVSLPVAGGGQAIYRYDDVGGGLVTAVSRREPSLPGASGSGSSQVPPGAVSADGRYVLFLSAATNLVAGQVDVNDEDDVFLVDRQTGQITLVSRSITSPSTAANRGSTGAALSADGRFVAFVSEGTDLVPGQLDSNSAADVFLYDRQAGTILVVSRKSGSVHTTGDGASEVAVISADGRFVAFESRAVDLVPLQVDGVGNSDVFLFDRDNPAATRLVSRSTVSPATSGNGQSTSPSLSADGLLVAFQSLATNLVTGQSGSGSGVYLYDTGSGATTLVSHRDGAPGANGNGPSGGPFLSADGRFVAFESLATDLVPGQVDTNGELDVFLYERATGVTALVSRVPGTAATAGDEASSRPTVSADGTVVAFSSRAANLAAGQVDALGTPDVFVHDRAAGTTTLASRAAGSAAAAGNRRSDRFVLSADGRFVAFESQATDLVPGQADGNDSRDVFLHDRVTDTTILVSRPLLTLGAAGRAGVARTGNGASANPAVSADGTVVAFESDASDLTPDADLNGLVDAFVWASPCARSPGPRPCSFPAPRPAP